MFLIKSTFASSSPAAECVFSRFRLRSTQEARRYNTYDARLSPGQAPWCMLSASGAAISRDCSPARRAARDHGNPQCQFLAVLAAAVSVSHRPSSSMRYGSHQKTAAALQPLPFSTATDDASACAGEHAMFSVFGGNRNEHAVQLRRHCRQVFNRAICNDFLVVLFVKFP